MRRWLLGAIVFLALVLRVVALDQFPVGFTPDEASFGYDAYSLLETGKDQWGNSFPLILESFGDFKPPLYAYLATPFVYLLDLTKTATRLPNALLGSAAVFVVYLMVVELFEKSKQTKRKYQIALVSALLLAISPWHVMMSRGAFEANLTTFLLPLGIFLLLKGFKKPSLFIWAAIVLGINLFSYHSARLLTPLIMFIFAILYRGDIRKLPKNTLLLSGGIFILFLSLATYTLFQGGTKRAADISVYSGALNEAAEQRTGAILSGEGPTIARVLHNKYQVSINRFVNNYTQYTSFRFLFTDGPAEATYGMIPGRGVLYWFELPFILGFLYALFKLKDKRPSVFILSWVLIAPIAAALTLGRGYAANRAVIMIPAIQILLAIGAVSIWVWLKKTFSNNFARVVLAAYVVVALIFVSSFLEDYFILSPLKTDRAMLYGNLETARWLKNNVDSDIEIVVDKKLSEPHIYIAFTNKWDPVEYQKNTKDWERYKTSDLKFVDQLGEYKLGNYTFRNIHFPVDKNLPTTLLIGRPEDFDETANEKYKVLYKDGEPSIIVVETSDQGIEANE